MAPVGCIFQLQLTGFIKKMWTRHESHTTFVLPMLPSDYCFCLALNAMICQWTPTIVFQGVEARCSLSRASSSFFPQPQKRCWSCQTFGCKLTQQTMAYSFSLLAYLIPIPQRKNYRKQEFCILGKKRFAEHCFQGKWFFHTKYFESCFLCGHLGPMVVGFCIEMGLICLMGLHS